MSVATRSQQQILDEAAEIVRGFKPSAPKDPHSVARLLDLCEESGLSTLMFAQRVRINSAVLYLWRKGQTSSHKPWPALAAAIAKRQGAALAATANAALSPEQPASAPVVETVNDSAIERAKALITATRGGRLHVYWDKYPDVVAEIVRLHRESGMPATTFLEAAGTDATGKLGIALGLRHKLTSSYRRKPEAGPVAKAAKKQTGKAAAKKLSKRKPPHAPPVTVTGVTFNGAELRVARNSPTFRAALLAALGVEQ